MHSHSKAFSDSSLSVQVVEHMASDVFDSQHGLLTSGLDLRLRQQETITTFVTQLEGEGVLHAQVISPVVRATSSRVCNEKSHETKQQILHTTC